MQEFKKIKVDYITRKPETRFEPIYISDIKFHKRVLDPNVYVINTLDDISDVENIEFDFEGIRYTLNDIVLHHSNLNQSGYVKIIECRYCKQEAL